MFVKKDEGMYLSIKFDHPKTISHIFDYVIPSIDYDGPLPLYYINDICLRPTSLKKANCGG